MITIDSITEEKRRSRAYRIFFFLFIVVILLFSAQIAAAESSEITFLKKLEAYDIADISSYPGDALRVIGFGIIKFLAWMGDSLYSGLQQVFDAITFSYSDEIIALTKRYSVLYKSFFLVAVVGFGLYLIMKKGQKELNTVMCVFVMILILSGMPLMMQKIGNLTVASSHFVTQQWNNSGNEKKITSISGTVLKESIVDLRKVDKNMTDTSLPKGLKKGSGYNNFNSNTWKTIDINSRMDYESKDYTLNHQSVWENKLEASDESGQYELTKIDGWTKFTSNYYYRYQITSWFGIFVMLGCMSFLLFFLIIRAAKIVIDLAGAMIYTPFIAVTDLTTGQRIKEAIKDIIAHFAAMFVLAAFMGIYFVAFTWINSSNLSIVPQLGMHVALVWAILDGPNIIERIIGVDAGFSGVWKTVLAAKSGADIARGFGSMASRAGKGAASAAGKAAKGAGAAAVGKEKMNQMNKKVQKAKDTPGKAVRNATDGKGLLGFGQNAAKGAGEKIAGVHTSESLQNQSHLANSSSGRSEAKDPRGAARSQSGNLRSKNSAAASRMPGGSASGSSKQVSQRPQSVHLNSNVREMKMSSPRNSDIRNKTVNSRNLKR